MARISDVFAFNVESYNVSRKIYSFNSRITVRGQSSGWIILDYILQNCMIMRNVKKKSYVVFWSNWTEMEKSWSMFGQIGEYT